MKNYQSKDIYDAGGERLSRRSTKSSSVKSLPRLVVSDTLSATKVFVAKTRSEVEGLNSFLRSMTSLPAESES